MSRLLGGVEGWFQSWDELEMHFDPAVECALIRRGNLY